MKTNKASGSRAGLALLSVLVPLAAGLVIAGYNSCRNYERHYRAEVEKQLSAIAELKVAQIVQWRRERLADATYFLHTSYAAGCALNVLNDPASKPDRQMFTAWLRAVLADGPYEQALLLDERLNVGLVYPEGASRVLGEAVRHAVMHELAVLGFTVLEAGDGPEALCVAAALPNRRIDLLLTDVVMPEMDGCTLAARLRERQPGLKVLFSSGYTRKVALGRFPRHSGDGFLAKPYNAAALAHTICHVLGENQPTATPTRLAV